MPKNSITPAAREALERLIEHAQRGTGQSERVANFLLAWWNAKECGGFDLTELWSVDDAIAADMITVVAAIADASTYPDTLGFKRQFEELVRQWRPKLGTRS